MYGPVRTVVWEGWSREAPSYPDSKPRALPGESERAQKRGREGGRYKGNAAPLRANSITSSFTRSR